MKLIQLSITPEQIRKLRKMKGIKINPKHKAMSGEGLSMLVDEFNYNALTKRFDTNKGIMFSLSQSEIEANKDLDRVADEDVKEVMSGAGLFKHNKKAKKTIKKIIDALENDMEGKGHFKSAKKAAKKATNLLSNQRNLLLKM